MSFVEHLVGEYYRKLGYIVSSRIKYPSKKWGWKDIDLLAINAKELLAIECKGGARNHSEMVAGIIEDSRRVGQYIDKNIPIAEGKTRKNLLVTSFLLSPRTLETKLGSEGIEIRYLDDILIEFLKLLKKEMNETGKTGKEEDYVTRTLKYMIEKRMIKDELFE